MIIKIIFLSFFMGAASIILILAMEDWKNNKHNEHFD